MTRKAVTPVTLVLTLSDVAALAGVRRPVVSMWRSRFAGTNRPFPPALQAAEASRLIAAGTGSVTFDAVAVARWLESTGHGNNPAPLADLAAYARSALPVLKDDPTHVAAVTALLCLKAVAARPLGSLDLDDLLDLADETDPDDTFLFREIDGLGQDATAVARYVDALADAAFSPSAALERVTTRTRAGRVPTTALAPAVRDLVSRAAVLLATAQGGEPRFADVSPGGSDLLIDTLDRAEQLSPTTVITAEHDSPADRLLRRRLRARGLLVTQPDEAADGSRRPTVSVAQLPPVGPANLSPIQMLDLVDDLALGMAGVERALVVGPASLLVEKLADAQAEKVRDGVLRTHQLHAAITLPAGLLLSEPRRHLALWVLGPPRRKVAPADRWTVVSDLRNGSLDATTIDRLLTDIATLFADESLVAKHDFFAGRRIRTAELLVSRSMRTTPVAAAIPGRLATEAVVELRTLAEQTHLADVFAVSPRDTAFSPPARESLSALVATRRARVFPGARIESRLIIQRTTGTDSLRGAPVIGPSELLGDLAWGERRVDRFEYELQKHGARFTEPGDVVFCTTPRIDARVDEDGGCVVQYPARVLRCRRPEKAERLLVPPVVAADITAQPAHAKRWRDWLLRTAATDEAPSLVEVLDAVQDELKATERRLASLRQLTAALMDGVTDDYVTVTRAVPSDERP